MDDYGADGRRVQVEERFASWCNDARNEEVDRIVYSIE